MTVTGCNPSFETNESGRAMITAACDMLKSGDATECSIQILDGSRYERIHTIEPNIAQANIARIMYGGESTSSPNSTPGIALIPYWMVGHVSGRIHRS